MENVTETTTNILEDIRVPTREQLTEFIEKALVRKFGKNFDPETHKMKQTDEYDEQVKRNMGANCNRVSKIVQEVVGGERQELVAEGSSPEITYQKPGSTEAKSITTAYARASHRFVVDDKNRVWDPITEEWGLTMLDDYKKRLGHSNTSRASFSLVQE